MTDGPPCGTSTQHAALKIVQGTLHNNVASDGQLYMNGTNLPPLFEFDFIDTHLWIASKQVCVTNRATRDTSCQVCYRALHSPALNSGSPAPTGPHYRERERRAAGHVCILLFRKQFKDQATSVDSQEPHQFCSAGIKAG